MRSFVIPAQKNRALVWAAALVLLAVSLVIPQLTWADHASDHPTSQFDDPDIISPSEAYAALVEKYKTGELVYHAPGRRDDRSFAPSPNEAYAALVEKYKTGELVYHAPGRRDDRSFAPAVNSGLTDEAFLAANPEVLAYWRSVSAQQEGAEASSARWVALGSYYTARNAAFLADNPEADAYLRYVAQQGCSEVVLEC